jgi:TolA-binding protein
MDLQYGPAERELRQLLVRFQAVDDVKYLSDTLFWLGYCLEKQSLPGEARCFYEQLAEKYPATAAAQQACARLAQLPGE